MDVLTDVLDALQLKGWIASRRALVPPWRYDFAASPDMILHLLSCGGATSRLKETRRLGGSRMELSCSSPSGTLTPSATT